VAPAGAAADTITTLSVMPQGNAGAMATAEPECSTANIVPCQPVFGCMDAEHFDNVKASGDDCMFVIDESNTCQSNDKVERIFRLCMPHFQHDIAAHYVSQIHLYLALLYPNKA